MTKIAGSYASVVRGVSEQPPQDRLSGQHHEQVNIISDPVRGDARRHGSIMQDEAVLSDTAQPLWPALLASTAYHTVTTFYINGVEHDLIHRRRPDYEALYTKGFAWCFNKATGKFLPVVYSVGDAALNALLSGGVSASVNIGRYVYLAGNTLLPTYTTQAVWDNSDNKKVMAVWIRGGAYNRTFSVTLTKTDGTKVEASYKTLSSAYPGDLSTADIPASDPEYQKKVNDRVNAYNSQVTQWITISAEDITTENIAEKLVEELLAQDVAAYRVDGTVCIYDANFVDVSADDGGDGSLIRAVGNKVNNVDLVSATHYVGKVIKVEPEQSAEAIYLKAEAKDEVSTGWTEVVWRETAGFVMQPQVAFCMGTVHNGSFYLAGTPAKLAELTGLDVPTFQPNAVGDQLSCPLPDMFTGRPITYLGLFQDRLVIGAGATLLLSRPGDYFNWFRKSVATVADDDPWEGFALGTEDDTIRHSVLYDRNLILYGERFQYMLSGREMFSPKTAAIVTFTAYQDATEAAPRASGTFVFYGKSSGEAGNEVTSLHQMQPGIVADTPESPEVSQQLDRYLSGRPVEIVAMTSPNMVLLRTDKVRNGLYTYGYLDTANGGERLFDSWSRWEWSDRVGKIVGLSQSKGGIYVYLLRTGTTPDGTPTIWIACERFVRDTALAYYPYLDSLRPVSSVTAPGASAALHLGNRAEASAAVATGDKRLLGTPLSGWEAFSADYPGEVSRTYAGFDYAAYFTPTNPFVLDRNGKAVLSGRLTLGKVVISVSDTAGMLVTVSSLAGDQTSLDFSGRILGSPPSLIGTQPVVSATLNATIGREARECTYTISAKRWLPLTVSSIEWVGQMFNNVRRA